MKTKLYSLISLGFFLATFLSPIALNAQNSSAKSPKDQTRSVVSVCGCEIISHQNVSCHDGTDGEATVMGTGDGGPFTFLWSNGQTTATATGLSAETYSVIVYSSTGSVCSTCEVIIEEPALLECSIDGTDLLCNGDEDGEADLTVTGGTAPFTYLWSNGATTEDLTGLDGGDYSVTVTDANGCITSCDVSIYEPELLECSIDGTDLLCNGDANGAADLTVTGGTEPFTYLWSNGATTEDLSGLDGGDYSVTVTDANGCTTSCNVSIYEPELLECSIDGTDLLCNGDANGAADLTVTGGTAPFTYLWSNGETTENISGLDGGDYSVTVTDANGCTTSCDVSIYEPELLECSIDGTDLLCNGDANGAADLTVTGGTAPFTYLWSNGETTEDLSGLDGGDYSVTVTDANGCTTSCDVSIYEPELLECEITDIHHGTPGQDDCEYRTQTQGGWGTSANGNNPGVYRDANFDLAFPDGLTIGCDLKLELTSSMAVENFLPSGGTPSMLSENMVDPTGYGNTLAGQLVALSLSVGFDNYDPDFSAATTPLSDLIVADGMFAGWSVEMVINEANNFIGDCGSSYSASELNDVLAGINENFVDGETNNGFLLCEGDGNCEDGSATANAIGGTPPYSYLWSDGQTTATATNLSPGIYTVTITDANGCTSICTVEIECDEVEEECGECEGQMTSLDLQYQGSETDATIKVYKGKVQPDKLLAEFDNVNNGDVLSFTGTGGDNKMGAKIRITIDGESGYTEIHTSCSQDIYVGLIAGDFEITAGTSHEGGPLCPGTPPDEDDCGECEGQITSLDLEYQGSESDVTIKVYKGKVKPDKLFETFIGVNTGDLLSFVGPGNSNKMGSKIRITIDGESGYTEIHTSCSQDIYVGMVFGDFEIIAGTSHEGGPLCEDGDKSADDLIAGFNNKDQVSLTAYPNPSNQDDVTISFKVPVTTRARLEVYNIMGERIAILFDGIVLENSINTSILDASELTPGMYFYRLNVKSDEIAPVTISKLIITK